MERGFVHLTVVLDFYTGRELSHMVAIALETDHAVEILKEALSKYGASEIVPTDQGRQFTATSFTYVVLCSGANLSMDG